MRDIYAQFDLYIIYARPVGSVGSLLCLYETFMLSWICVVFIQEL